MLIVKEDIILKLNGHMNEHMFIEQSLHLILVEIHH